MSDAAPGRPDYARLLAGGFDLRGRAAVVPGGYGGIGEAIAWGLALAGARVAVAGRSSGKAEALAARLADAGHDAIGVAMDAHATESIRAAVDAVAARFGALTFSLARELAAHGVTANAIAPAYVRTPMVTEQLSEAQRQALLAQIPVGRFCEPEEFAHVVSFLCSPLSGFITGEILDLNGGLQMD